MFVLKVHAHVYAKDQIILPNRCRSVCWNVGQIYCLCFTSSCWRYVVNQATTTQLEAHACIMSHSTIRKRDQTG